MKKLYKPIIILLLSVIILPSYTLAQNSKSSNKTLLASLYCATLGAWLNSPSCIDDVDSIIPTYTPETTIVNQTFNSATTQSSVNQSADSISPTSRPSSTYTNTDITSIVDSAVQKALSSYTTNTNSYNPNDFVTRDFLQRQIGAIGDSTGKSITNVSSNITTSGTLTNPTISGATITGSTFSGTTATFSGGVGIGSDATYTDKNLTVGGVFSTQGSVTSFAKTADNGWTSMMKVRGDYVYLANYDAQLFSIYKIINGVATLISETPCATCSQFIDVQGKYAYVGASSLNIFDISNPTAPVLVSSNAGYSLLGGFTVSGNLLIGGHDFSGTGIFHVYDISNPLKIRKLTPATGIARGGAFQIVGNILYVAQHSTGNILIYDISVPSAPAYISTINVSTAGAWTLRGFKVVNEYLYAPNSGVGLKIYDLSDLSSPTRVGFIPYTASSLDVEVNGKYAYVTFHADSSCTTNGCIRVYDVSDVTNPVLLTTMNTASSLPYQAAITGSNLVVVNAKSNNSSIEVFPIGGLYSHSIESGMGIFGKLNIYNETFVGGRLDVLGGGWFTGPLFTSGSLAVVGTSTSGIIPTLMATQNGLVGIGTTTPYSTLSVWGTGTSTARLFELTNSASTTLVSFRENGIGYFSDNIGLGTTSPYAKLSVVGEVVARNFTATSTTATTTLAGGLNVGGYIGIGVNGGSSASATFPDTKLHIMGLTTSQATPGVEEILKMSRTGNNGSYPQVASLALGTYSNNGAGNSWGPDTRLDFRLKSTSAHTYTTDQTILSLLDNGNVGIATTTPWRTLSVVGTVAVNGLTANSGSNYAVCINNTTKELTADVGGACNPSSERFKNNIQPLAVSATDIVSLLQPSTFIYNNADTSNATTSLKYGLIAEQVSLIDPHLATYEEDGTTPHGLDTSAILSVLVKAVQELTTKLNNYIGQGIATVKDMVVEKLTANTVIANGIQMKDRTTGQVYCVILDGGEFDKRAGDCDSAIATPTPTSSTVMMPVESSNETPIVTPVSTSTETIVSTDTPSATPTPTETPTETASPTPTLTPTPIPTLEPTIIPDSTQNTTAEETPSQTPVTTTE